MNPASSNAGDLKGGVASAVVGLAQVLTLGLLAFGALGVEHANLAVRAAFSTAIFGGVIATLMGGTPIPGAGVRTSTTLIFATLVATLAVDPTLAASGMDRVQAVMFLSAASLAASGVIQVAFGLARLGSVAKFAPYPVIAGFMNGVAILIVLAQVPYLLGLGSPVRGKALLEALPALQPWTMGVGFATAAFIWLVAPRWKKLPAALMALFAGTALYYLVAAVFPGAVLGPRLGEIAATLPLPAALMPLASRAGLDLLLSHWQPVLGTALVLAVIGSLDSLIAAAGIDVAHNTRHRPNRELVGLGLGNIVCGAFGGVPVAFSPTLAIAAYRGGSRTRRSSLVTSVVLLGALMLGAPALAFIPLTVLAGIMVTVGVGLVDRWAKELMHQLARGDLKREGRWSLAVVSAVCVVTVAFNFVVAVVFGLIASMALFIASMSRSLVRATWTGLERGSRRVYSDEHTHQIRQQAQAIRILDLEGAVFFGSVVRLAAEVEAHARDARFIILDFRRVGSVDATGAVMLEQLTKRMAANGVKIFFAHVMPEGRLGRMFADCRTFLARPRADWFEDVDRALEAAERGLIGDEVGDTAAQELPLEATSLLEGLSASELESVRVHLERRELEAGEILFREGDPGDHLYVLTQGSVTIMIGTDRRAQRIATFEPGIIFGEMAMLDGAARSATAVADQRAVAFSLSAAALKSILVSDPGLGNHLLHGVARHLANRVRGATDVLRAISDAGD